MSYRENLNSLNQITYLRNKTSQNTFTSPLQASPLNYWLLPNLSNLFSVWLFFSNSPNLSEFRPLCQEKHITNNCLQNGWQQNAVGKAQ